MPEPDLTVNLAAPAGASAELLGLLPDVEWGDDTIAHLEREGWVRVWLEGEVALDLFVPQHRFHAELLGDDGPGHRRLTELVEQVG